LEYSVHINIGMREPMHMCAYSCNYIVFFVCMRVIRSAQAVRQSFSADKWVAS